MFFFSSLAVSGRKTFFILWVTNKYHHQAFVQMQALETTSTVDHRKALKWKFQARHMLISGFIIILHMLWWIGSDLFVHAGPLDHTLMANLSLNKGILDVTKNMCLCF